MSHRQRRTIPTLKGIAVAEGTEPGNDLATSLEHLQTGNAPAHLAKMSSTTKMLLDDPEDTQRTSFQLQSEPLTPCSPIELISWGALWVGVVLKAFCAK